MHGPIVDLDVDVVPEVLLLVEDVVLGTGDDAGALDALDRLGHGHACEVRVGREALPEPPAGRYPAERAGHRAEQHVDALAPQLSPHHGAALADQRPRPRRRRVHARREHGVVIGYDFPVSQTVYSLTYPLYKGPKTTHYTGPPPARPRGRSPGNPCAGPTPCCRYTARCTPPSPSGGLPSARAWGYPQ